MRTRIPLTVTAIATVVLAGACTPGRPDAGPVTPPPSSPAGATPSADPTPSASPSAAASPTTAGPGPTTGKPRNCEGAVSIDVDLRAPGRNLPSYCLTVGGVLRLRGVDVNADTVTPPRDATSCFYAAGILSCRMISVQEFHIRVQNSVGDRRIAVTVIAVTDPPKPAPECTGVSTVTYRIPSDAMEYTATCMKAGSVVRLTGLGPSALVVRPAAAASCRYEAGVHVCRLDRRGTVTLGDDHTSEYRSIAVVVH